MGGELNAYTTKEETIIHASFLKTDFRRARELLYDVLANSTFPEKELEKEKRMVIGNPALLEKYAREKYLMKKPKQDIFVIVDEANQPIE